ncbi:MAG: response regulator transcription factor [Thiotrichaceae bacterium]
MSIRIVLADDHKIVRDGLRSLLEKQTDMEIVAEAEDGRTVVQQVQKLSPDIVIMDISMPGLNGIDATYQIIAKSPKIKVLALSMHSDKRFVEGMLKAGASGYILKDSAFTELISAIRVLTSNQIYLSPPIASVVTNDYISKKTKAGFSVGLTLTTREREVLQLLAEGKSTKGISSALNVSVKTIETHRKKIMEKLNIHNIAELTKYAIREGLTTL